VVVNWMFVQLPCNCSCSSNLYPAGLLWYHVSMFMCVFNVLAVIWVVSTRS
jgi:hypothetical protein